MRSSLEEVCRRVARGASNILADGKELTRVRTWSGEQLVAAKRRGERVTRAEDRARTLLRAVQDKKLWVPDPIGVEHMVAARHTACDDHDEGGVCVKIGDCDDLVILLGACFMSVGLYTMVVGHSYSDNKVVGHVLLKVYCNGKWYYADPSPLGNGKHMAFGECAPFTREIYYSMPEIRVVCDAESCDVRNFDPDELGFVQKGTFIGVNGIPVEELPPEVRVRWLGEVVWLSSTDESALKSIAEECSSTVSSGFDTKASREKTFSSSAKCTADAACTFYSKGAIPPGVCSTMAQPLISSAISVWNGIFGDSEEAERARIRDANTAKFFQSLDKLLVMDAAWAAYSQNTMTRLIRFHDENLPSQRGAWGGGSLQKSNITYAEIVKPGIPEKYQTWAVEAYSNPCPVFFKLVSLNGLPTKTPPKGALCSNKAVSDLYYEFVKWSEKHPGAGAVEGAQVLENLTSKTLPSWIAALDTAANTLRNEVVAEMVRTKLEGGKTAPPSITKALVTSAGVTAAAWFAWKYLLPVITGGKA